MLVVRSRGTHPNEVEGKVMMALNAKFVSARLHRAALATVFAGLAALAVGSEVLAGPEQKTFASPAEAAQAFADALSANDTQSAQAILGPEGEKLLHSGDAVADRKAAQRFLGAYAKQHRLEQRSEEMAILHVGEQDWPFPIPIVRKNGAWLFDTAAGADEILNRRIGRNELNAIQVCLAVVDAQREYASTDHDGSGVRAFARRLVSTPGKKDGLYWPSGSAEQPSPLGPLVARAAEEGYPTSAPAGKRVPYHGYYYRMLTGQGGDANGGAYDYLVDNRMVGGFALVAYPARYKVSGIMTFIVNHDGTVYEKDLGQDTSELARSMTTFNPDEIWRRIPAPGGGH
jgi:hypothetical protein